MDAIAKPDAASKPKAPKSADSPGMAFEMQKFDPMAFQGVAENGIAQAQENYAKLKVAVEEMTDMVGDTYSASTTGTTAYGLKIIETARANIMAGFEFTGALMSVKSPSEAMALSTAHARKQSEVLAAQTKELWALAQKVATDAAEPIKTGLSNTFQKVASK